MAKITIPVITPSLNELLKMHYHDKTKLKGSHKAHVRGSIHDMGMKITRMRKPRKRSMEIRCFRAKLLDVDNLIGGTKLLTDAIKEVGLIWDDSPEYIDSRVTQLKDKYDPRTEIFIEEIK